MDGDVAGGVVFGCRGGELEYIRDGLKRCDVPDIEGTEFGVPESREDRGLDDGVIAGAAVEEVGEEGLGFFQAKGAGGCVGCGDAREGGLSEYGGHSFSPLAVGGVRSS